MTTLLRFTLEMKQRHDAQPFEPAKILLVDDNSDGLIARRALLQELGYRVQTAQDGASAYELFSQDQFALVVTDHKMPRMTGLELIQKIRSQAPDTLIILVSGFVDALGLTEQSTGADVVISKSAGEVSALMRSVVRLLSRRVPRKSSPPPRLTSRSRALH